MLKHYSAQEFTSAGLDRNVESVFFMPSFESNQFGLGWPRVAGTGGYARSHNGATEAVASMNHGISDKKLSDTDIANRAVTLSPEEEIAPEPIHLLPLVQRRVERILYSYLDRIDVYKAEFSSRLCELLTDLLASEMTDFFDAKNYRVFAKLWLGEETVLRGDVGTKIDGIAPEDLFVTVDFSNGTVYMSAVVFATRKRSESR